MLVRRATLADLDHCSVIYNHYVETSVAIFDTRPMTSEAADAWFQSHQDEAYPLLVAEAEEQVIGYGSLSRWSSRDAYGKTCEVSVFVRPDYHRRGAGAGLVEALIDAAQRVGHRCLIARIEAENDASIALFRNAGFTSVGVMHQAGYKFDTWLDVEIMEHLIEATPAAAPVAGVALELVPVPGDYAVARLAPTEPWPEWPRGAVICMTRTNEELSIVCAGSCLPSAVQAERDFKVLRVAGPLAFSQVGVLAALTAPLAAADISTFAISTFDTDYLLCKSGDWDRMLQCLRDAGHRLEGL